jgi:hypothetical protein
MSGDDPYLAYLARFQKEVGAVAVGHYGKYQGKLVRKLNPAEFAKKHDELAHLVRTYRGIIERGDTINDAITKLLRERQIELLIDEEIEISSPQ